MQLKPNTLLQGGKYRIIRVLGQGGFGITYEAEQVVLRRTVALKEFFMKDCCERDEATSRMTVGTGSQRALVEKFRGKFIREAQMMAGMDHPSIVRVTDVFEENDTAYYVMDNLPGGSLKSLVESRGPLSEADAELYIRQVAGALAYIHSQKTVHLDVKPSNILLNSRGEAVLIDFGISKHYDSAGEQTSSTPVGISKGFAPLEQGRDGDVSQFQPPTDIYALGATLYYLVSGIVPPEASIAAEDGIPRPAGLSDRLWNAISLAMKPFRRERPQSIEDFLALLGTIPAQASKPKDTTENERDDDVTIVKGSGQGQGSVNGYKWVDLGLPSGLKWATCNVGASSPGERGNYYAWGETNSKDIFKWHSYRFQAGMMLGYVKKLSKYNDSHQYGKDRDGKTRLDPVDDAASVLWGGRWRMPTKAEQDELCQYCEWEWSTFQGKPGYKVTGRNGNFIFLPAGGYRDKNQLNSENSGYYWSSTLCDGYPEFAYSLLINRENKYWLCFRRCCGLLVRPVTE